MTLWAQAWLECARALETRGEAGYEMRKAVSASGAAASAQPQSPVPAPAVVRSRSRTDLDRSRSHSELDRPLTVVQDRRLVDKNTRA